MENVEGYRNLKVRGSVYWWRQKIKNESYFESLHVPYTGRQRELKEAIDMMQIKQQLARSAKFMTPEMQDAMDVTRTKTICPTVGKILDRYKLAAKSYGLQPQTIKKNINCLKLVIRAEYEGKPDDLSSNVLTDDLVRSYRDSVLAAAAADQGSQDRARRTIRSTLRQARSVFAGWTRDEYKTLKLPDMEGFMKGGALRVHDKLYTYPPKELVDATLKAGRALPAAERMDLYAVFLLAYDCGMRSDEAAAAEKSWLQGDHIEVRYGKTWTTRRVARKVPINPETLEDLKTCLRKGEKHFVPGASQGLRYVFIQTKFSSWMRSIGWAADKYQHTTHELRALRGSKWYTEQGASVARDLLGHTSVTTTCRAYAALDVRPKALPREK